MAVRDTSCCFFYHLTVCMSVFVRATEQKATKLTLWSHRVPPMFEPPSETSAIGAHIHLHNTTRDKHFYSPSLLSFTLAPLVDESVVIIGGGPAPNSQ